jgi:hypothetical protein
VTPGGGTVTPGGGTVTPGGGTVTPGGGTVTPGGGTVTPGGGVTPEGGDCPSTDVTSASKSPTHTNGINRFITCPWREFLENHLTPKNTGILPFPSRKKPENMDSLTVILFTIIFTHTRRLRQ